MAKAAPTVRPTVPDQVNVITLKCAKEWRQAFKDQNKTKGFAPGEFPTAIAIPFPDIEQVVNDFKKLDAAININGIRLYFIIKPGGPNGKLTISGIVVPTRGPLPNPEGVFNDMIVNATLKAGAPKNPYCPGPGDGTSSARIATVAGDPDDGYVSIYDVTRPCPPFCDDEW